ncbi:hypothetical protein [Pseudidiomarina terrestris]|uniref:hypothetical protein n=1 Tax=Pseudidiomarina terrestris TaxID=2820060 RepID=UPI002655ABB2|nr:MULTISPECIES: hypothetical protein [unclassified Pseudidiomarina]MDN7126633.1 hypothetical protein [Pseudidiomarina sp. 1APR75-33.1]MDN7135042.1 hypothetical protein [Pseudidiomarina sp. 1ASP75-5]MDN7137713.1 hypothetical protein [Pseudidiomarina sp. 1ASP75-14]MEA3587179.1 hypothetical protein [Pseudidiomarina sp. 1APP75-27a]
MPWRWCGLPSSVWGVDPEQKKLLRLDSFTPLQLAQPSFIFLTPWLVFARFERVHFGNSKVAPRWWCCCVFWTDGQAFARCRRLFLAWREH